MAQPSSFSGQICNWLTSISFQCRAANEPDWALPVLEIAASDRVVLKVIPVDLATWQKINQEGLLNLSSNYLQATRSQGVPAVLLWEDYWLARKSIVQSRLAAMLGISAKIPARLTLARRIDKAATEHFLETNHLNGSTLSKFRYGLFLPKRYYRVLPEGFVFDASADEMLVAVATFSNARIFEQNGKPFRSHELIRFASLLNTNVVGALDKLLNAFIREKAPDDIMTYADLEWSDGRSYKRLGFEERGYMPPRKALVELADMRRVRTPVETGQPTGESPVEYLTVYNLGSIKYVRDIKTNANES
ncbi:hypothetical protein J2Y45_003736 [Dyadobacter sp. BE34]|uniref:Uncharacterized protein n=1 Tax=Dyadobacter fermentans TaxID=94254 RepID=A0ABU1R0W8_9BACT|nr:MULTISPECIES: hypothetical protein [Dyadobacter]MDR6806544.1 hypothetical protein [Dyadobacter fermentans]MDR7044285.1 hypothetical protein [Dyadobacter sp. BE242]MDR7198596.1 hypothetical protein [Dyadobacter sp. BE34]MDR7216558.1 hypothetical protein [Dyadobacter sp. BE31]MDR7263916.1 hypothetical protein [Dyadobacter sp. BE32]